MPPTLNALTLYLRRAAYQCYIWKNACERILDLLSPIEHGWVITDADLKPEYTILGGVPNSILELVSCRCQKGCKTNVCACRRAYLVCTDARICDQGEDCENTVNFSNGDDSENV